MSRFTLSERIRAIAVAWSCLFLQLVGVAHFALIRHEVCAHNEFVHSLHDPSLANTLHETRDADLQFVALEGEEHGHDHCAFVLRSRETPPPLVNVVMERPDFLTVVRATAPPTDAPVPAATSGWRAAPKQSPPA